MLKFRSYIPYIWFKINRTKCGKRCKLTGWPMVLRYPKAEIKIGDEVIINSNFFSNLLGLYQRTIIIARGEGKIDIGNRVGISGTTIYARNKIEIGDHTLVGANCKIIDNDFHPIDAEDRLNDNREAIKTRPVKIGKNVFIGCNSIILKGSIIGDNCVVGAGSVVSGVFEDNVIIAGNPAKVIKKL